MTARTLVWTGFIAIAAFVLMAANRLTVLDPVENVTLNVTAPIQSVLHDATRPVADWVNNLTDASGLSSENQKLRAENERLTNELARAREAAVQQQNQADLDAVRKQFPNDTFLAASVVSRDTSNVRSVVAIDRGSGDGVERRVAVGEIRQDGSREHAGMDPGATEAAYRLEPRTRRGRVRLGVPGHGRVDGGDGDAHAHGHGPRELHQQVDVAHHERPLRHHDERQG